MNSVQPTSPPPREEVGGDALELANEVRGVPEVEQQLTNALATQTEKKVEAERIFRLLVDSVKDYAIFMLDVNGEVATWNRGARALKGYEAHEIIGKHFSKFYPRAEVEAGKCERELEEAKLTGRFEDEGWRVRKDGSRFWANVVITAVHDTDGELIGFAKVTRDLTQRKRSEEEARARIAAEQTSRTKDEFLAMLGHELRNPLAPIVSALQILKLRGDTRNVREHQIIERQVNQMVRLVEDLLDVSRISRGKIELKKQAIDLREVLARATEMAIPTFERKGQRFEVRVPGAPLMLQGDEARLSQVFVNLLNNAGKYTPDGGRIDLVVSQVGRELMVEVRDTGVGIDAELLPRVFELFVQGYRDIDRSEGGLGIGLTLVRALVQLHGGRVEVHSGGRGQGSVFTVYLQADHAAPVAEAAGGQYSAIGAATTTRRVLVVDDNIDARDMLAELLSMVGHEVKTAGDGPAALEVARSFAPQVAVLDIGLPGMNGHELARCLRRLDGGGQMRLIALTGYGQSSDREKCIEAGFDGHFVKPIDLESLLEWVASDVLPKSP
jgi:PAS domain S-box-containing protein